MSDPTLFPEPDFDPVADACDAKRGAAARDLEYSGNWRRLAAEAWS